MAGADHLHRAGAGSAWRRASCSTRSSATPVVLCDQVAWSLAGISMAGWNAILSLGLAWLWWRVYASSSASQ